MSFKGGGEKVEIDYDDKDNAMPQMTIIFAAGRLEYAICTRGPSECSDLTYDILNFLEQNSGKEVNMPTDYLTNN